MHIEQLHVTSFRNIGGLTLVADPGLNVLYGNNGAGKTNILEAVFLLLLGRSQRGASDTQLMNNTGDHYRLHGTVRHEDRQFDVAVACPRGGRKKITIDRISTRPAELFERFCVVSLGPEDTEIVAGGPQARRSLLDMSLAQFSGSYLHHLIMYYRALKQKNAALRQDNDHMLFDPILIEHGVPLIQSRLDFIASLGVQTAELYRRLAPHSDIQLRYAPSFAFDTTSTETKHLATQFEQALHQKRTIEKVRRLSLVGPHRDELDISINNLPARTHASRGEWRSAAIAIKLGIYELLRAQRQYAPILLLDELFAELDLQRAGALVETFGKFGQLFVTTAGKPSETLRNAGKRFHIVDGAIEQES